MIKLKTKNKTTSEESFAILFVQIIIFLTFGIVALLVNMLFKFMQNVLLGRQSLALLNSVTENNRK